MKPFYSVLFINLALTLTACSQNPSASTVDSPNQSLLGTVHIHISGNADEMTSSAVFTPHTTFANQGFSDPGNNTLSFTRAGVQTLTLPGSIRYINANFTVNNTADQAMKYFLIAIDTQGVEGSIEDTPFYEVADFNGAALSSTDVSALGLVAGSTYTYDTTVRSMVVDRKKNSYRSGLDTSGVAAAAQDAGLVLFDYGYGILSGPGPNSYEAIPAQGSGQVTISTRYDTSIDPPSGTGDPYAFSMRFAVVEDTTP